MKWSLQTCPGLRAHTNHKAHQPPKPPQPPKAHISRVEDVADHFVELLFHRRVCLARELPAGHEHHGVADVGDVGDGGEGVVHHGFLWGKGEERLGVLGFLPGTELRRGNLKDPVTPEPILAQNKELR